MVLEIQSLECEVCLKNVDFSVKIGQKVAPTIVGSPYCYIYQKYGHRAQECRSKPKWTSNKETKVPKQGNSYNQDYNTRYSCHHCGEYPHVVENCIRKHFKGNYNRWMNGEVVCFIYLKVGHVCRNCPIRSPTPNYEHNYGKGKVDDEVVKNQMKKIQKKIEDCNTLNKDEVTLSNGSGDHITPNQKIKICTKLKFEMIYFTLVPNIRSMERID